MEYEFNTLAQKYQSIPDDLREVMSSSDTIEIIREIAKDHGLLIDQTGALVETTSLVILGIIPSKDFISELSKRAEVSMMVATQISKDINAQVFSQIRESLRKMELAAENNAGDIEKAGNLTIEKNISDTSAAATDAEMSQTNVLKSIEDPISAAELPINVLTRLATPEIEAPAGSVPGTPTTPMSTTTAPAATPAPSLVNRLMNAPAAAANIKVEKKLAPGPDPYREPIE